MADIKQFDTKAVANEGAVLTVLDPGTGEATDIKITLHGADSDVYRKASDESQRDMAKRHAQGLVTSIAETSEDLSVSILVACTKGWDGMDEGEGNPVQFSPEEAARIYKRYPFIRDQVSRFIERRANFIPLSKEDLAKLSASKCD